MTITAGREALKQALYLRRKQLGRSGRNRKHKPQSWLYPWATEKHYAAAIRAWLRPMMDYVHTYLKNNGEAILRGDSAALVRQDAIPGGSYRRLIKSLNGWFTTYLPDITESGTRDAPPVVFMGLGNIAENLNDFNNAQWQKSAKAELGIEFPMYEEWWEPTKQTWQKENYKYFQDLGRSYIGQVNRKAEQAVISGWSVSQLAGEIRKIDNNIKQARANMIARDQIGKLNEMATQARMEQAGLTMYIWSTAQDERVRGKPKLEGGIYPNARPSHHLMEGLLCRWSDPTVYSDDGGKTWKPRPSGAVLLHPGRDIQCRCTALSYWDELVGEVDKEIWQQENPRQEYQEAEKKKPEKKSEIYQYLVSEKKHSGTEYIEAIRKEQDMLTKEEKEWYLNKLNSDEQLNVKDYTGEHYYDMNKALLGKKDMSQQIKERIDYCSKALSKFELQDDIITWKGTASKYYTDYNVGEVKPYAAFHSTTVTSEIAWSGDMLIQFRIPKGTEGAYINDYSVNKGEDEFILQKGLKYNVIERGRIQHRGKEKDFMILEVVK
jgi:uncharacterized protein with gpF-like domain